jgi:DNA-binding CsgD family transcriptional regulator
MRDDGVLTIDLRVADAALAERVAALLADVAGFALAGPGEPGDLILAGSDPVSDAAPLLTPREREVLALISEGASNKVIAQELGISVHTAKFHVGQVIEKLDATGRTEAVTHAARQGVIHL